MANLDNMDTFTLAKQALKELREAGKSEAEANMLVRNAIVRTKTIDLDRLIALALESLKDKGCPNPADIVKSTIAEMMLNEVVIKRAGVSGVIGMIRDILDKKMGDQDDAKPDEEKSD